MEDFQLIIPCTDIEKEILLWKIETQIHSTSGELNGNFLDVTTNLNRIIFHIYIMVLYFVQSTLNKYN